MDEPEYPSYKLIVIGDAGTGKTSIINRYVNGEFDSTVKATVGVANLHTVVKIDKNRSVDLKIWDTAGQEQYNALIPMFSRDSDVCAVVADFSRPETIQNIDLWVDRLHKSGENPPLIIVVNKTDLDGPKQMELINAELKVNYQNVLFVSAVTGNNISEIFQIAAHLADDGTNNTFSSPKLNKENDGGCC